jgi:hypothetical protein
MDERTDKDGRIAAADETGDAYAAASDELSDDDLSDVNGGKALQTEILDVDENKTSTGLRPR